MFLNARSEAVDGLKAGEAGSGETPFDFEAAFRVYYDRIARVLVRVVRDPACAEELAVEVFLKLWRSPEAHRQDAGGWLYRVAVRKGLDELRRRARRNHSERLLSFFRRVPTPEDLRTKTEAQEKVRRVLASLPPRQAELLILRSHGLSYGEVAAALGLNPGSVGVLVSRAQQAFRKEFVKRYGRQ